MTSFTPRNLPRHFGKLPSRSPSLRRSLFLSFPVGGSWSILKTFRGLSKKKKNSRPAVCFARGLAPMEAARQSRVALGEPIGSLSSALGCASRNIRRSISFSPLFNHGPGPELASGVGGGSLSRSPYRGVQCVDAPTRRGCWGAAAIAPLRPSFVRGCRATSVFLFQRRR